MAEILPVRAWRYNTELATNIDDLLSPLFDVVSDKQRAALYKNPLNSIHLSVPQPPLAGERAAMLLDDWKKNGVILQDKLPAIYVYYQYFKTPGSTRPSCRKGFIAHVRVYDWEDKVILRHENTIPKSVNDRVEILEKTGLHVSPTHGLYTDPTFTLEKLMDEAIASPLYESEDYQGVRDVVGVIHDGKAVNQFLSLIKEKKIILADGHHRYEGSLANMHQQKRSNPYHTGKEGYNFHLMYFTNTESDDLRILPTHRLIVGLPNFSSESVLEKLEKHFKVKVIDDATTLPEVIAGKQWTFGIVFKDTAYKIQLKPESIEKLHWPFPPEVKALDLTVMHYFIIEKILGIAGKEQRKSEHIAFDRNFADCLNRINDGRSQMAIITNEVSIEEVKKICDSGFTMPQKSTYFYPKVICGFLFSSIIDREFNTPVYYPFA
ncbi:DUF1015 domain-containing protein [Pseudochryseolinea flava]|uniref:DUF1015 domain-containing protein n=1 Tax=Pseudochryseolinea flava TaxID=2059302 RepID=A0A364XVT9_9BACT|nr:DUF1015 domain-containing protein [Pseudochryseolinea flava]RAV97837.1 DUF1015 domain-containing protein [Pseudochryseolinea flava]